eukprot:CAMPEP_0170394050 /NCGR_PEP_ID=MMETSP0117_2-20130122/21053_1 /TAXON_ID=400756 /ORGANISM="Durinskia baltica, Strain CSIRO CS-38" /LENGTH=283 /DNA_ID=CAMNT_0010650297 /DNA_START=86 /DNA_END=932 /DNA_ORIENTATION=+
MTPLVRKIAIVGSIVAVLLVASVLILVGRKGGKEVVNCGELEADGGKKRASLMCRNTWCKNNDERADCKSAVDWAVSQCRGMTNATAKLVPAVPNITDATKNFVECINKSSPVLIEVGKRHPKTIAAALTALLLWGSGVPQEHVDLNGLAAPILTPIKSMADGAFIWMKKPDPESELQPRKRGRFWAEGKDASASLVGVQGGAIGLAISSIVGRRRLHRSGPPIDAANASPGALGHGRGARGPDPGVEPARGWGRAVTAPPRGAVIATSAPGVRGEVNLAGIG